MSSELQDLQTKLADTPNPIEAVLFHNNVIDPAPEVQALIAEMIALAQSGASTEQVWMKRREIAALTSVAPNA